GDRAVVGDGGVATADREVGGAGVGDRAARRRADHGRAGAVADVGQRNAAAGAVGAAEAGELEVRGQRIERQCRAADGGDGAGPGRDRHPRAGAGTGVHHATPGHADARSAVGEDVEIGEREVAANRGEAHARGANAVARCADERVAAGDLVVGGRTDVAVELGAGDGDTRAAGVAVDAVAVEAGDGGSTGGGPVDHD